MLRSRGRIRIGPGFQAELTTQDDQVPELEELWSYQRMRQVLPEAYDTSAFVALAKTRRGYHDESVYLKTLHDCDYDVDAALDKLPAGLEQWTQEELDDFDAAVRHFKDNIRSISQSVPNKTRAQVVAHFNRKHAQEFDDDRPRRPTKRIKLAKRKRLNVYSNVDRDRLCVLFLTQARKVLDATTFDTFLHFLRLYDQHIIDQAQLASNLSLVLRDFSNVHDAFKFFLTPLPTAASLTTQHQLLEQS